MIRQGDVLLVPVLGIPKRVIHAPHKVLAVGEVVGHAHRFESPNVQVMADYHFNLFCKVLGLIKIIN